MAGNVMASEDGLFGRDIDAAFRQAKKLNRPLLIDFFGTWCPPCNQLDETVFSTPKFYKKSRSFVLLKVDADDQSSWVLKDKYRING
jgi:protein disulfide-isomerase